MSGRVEGSLAALRANVAKRRKCNPVIARPQAALLIAPRASRAVHQFDRRAARLPLPPNPTHKQDRAPNTSLCIVSSNADLPSFAGLPAPLPPPALGVACLRLGGDGDDGADPVADRACRQRDPGRRQARPAAAGAGDRRRRDPAPGADRGAAGRRRQGLAGGRIRPAPALLRAPAAARAGLLRLPADRAADVAGDGRPAVDPLLPRLRADLHHPEPADDHARQRGDDRDQPAAGADRAAAGPVRRLRRLPLQPGLAPGRAGGAAADRRADRGSRGEHLRHPHRQGLRPRGAPAAPLPARRHPCLRPEHLLDPPAGDLLAADRAAAADRHRPGAAGRRPRGDRRQPQPRQLHRLLHLRGDAGRADADARDDPGDGAAGDRLRQPPLRNPRSRAADREPARRTRAAGGRRAGRAARRDAALRRPPRQRIRH